MLIEFSVANFLSFRERKTFSMVAAKDNEHPENFFGSRELPGLKGARFLKSAALYGANASGKSNFVKALRYMTWYVRRSATKMEPGESTQVIPFKLSPGAEQEPSMFEIVFEDQGNRYRYGFAVDSQRVREEWLSAYPKGLEQAWFTRRFDEQNKEYEYTFSQAYFKGDRESLKGKTRENALFLSVGAQFNHEQLSRVYEWFTTKCIDFDFSSFNVAVSEQNIIRILEKAELDTHQITSMLHIADVNIDELYIKELSSPKTEKNYYNKIAKSHKIPNEVSDALKKLDSILDVIDKFDSYSKRLKMVHLTENHESILFDVEDESTGTIKFLHLILLMMEAAARNAVLVIDEVGASMHPLLLRTLVTSINSEANNACQLIFTTHDTTLLTNEYFRRDQIWFAEKDQNGATDLYSLADFDPMPRKDEPWNKHYLAGRYGAIPILGELVFD